MVVSDKSLDLASELALLDRTLMPSYRERLAIILSVIAVVRFYPLEEVDKFLKGKNNITGDEDKGVPSLLVDTA